MTQESAYCADDRLDVDGLRQLTIKLRSRGAEGLNQRHHTTCERRHRARKKAGKGARVKLRPDDHSAPDQFV